MTNGLTSGRFAADDDPTRVGSPNWQINDDTSILEARSVARKRDVRHPRAASGADLPIRELLTITSSPLTSLSTHSRSAAVVVVIMDDLRDRPRQGMVDVLVVPLTEAVGLGSSTITPPLGKEKEVHKERRSRLVLRIVALVPAMVRSVQVVR
jgi:hypothetical protein